MTQAAASNKTGAGIEVSGLCASRFSRVKDAFYENFVSRGEEGASVAVVIDGNPVVDLWGGYADQVQRRPWDKDTLVCVLSVSKEVTALALHMAADRGLIGYDDLVVKYWPEFGQEGKQNTKVRWLLDHRAGIPIVKNATPGMAYDWDRMITGLAATKPVWEPGTTPCYHSANYGYPVAELLRRVTGKRISSFIREEISKPLKLDCALALQPDEIKRAATFNPKDNIINEWMAKGENIFARSWKIFWDDEDFNSDDWRKSEIPSVNLHTNARSLAKLCCLIASGGEQFGTRLISSDRIARAAEIQWTGKEAQDRLLSMSLGFIMPTSVFRTTGMRTIGMIGAGGAVAFADPDRRLGFAYAMNKMDPQNSLGPRPESLIAALNEALDS